MTIQSGIDLIEVRRIAGALERHGARFLARIFTEREQTECAGRPERLAARFAVKEAVAKALGVGIGPVAWREIEVRNDALGRPRLHLTGAAARLSAEQALTWSISISHTAEHAIALAVAQATGNR